MSGGAVRFGLFVMGTRDGSYHALLEQMVEAEELGFDSVVLGERHFRHGALLYSSPLTIAAALAARTRRVRIGLAGRVLPLDHPLHVAEDAATVDVLSGGRLDFGAARRSLDDECHRAFRIPADETRERFREALEIIVKAWTEDEWSYDGRHYRIPPVSVFPRPLQKPHPPISVVAVSDETLQFAADAGYDAVLGATRTPAELEHPARLYRERSRSRRGDVPGGSLIVNRFIHVADSDARAHEEMRGPFLEFIDRRAPDLHAALAAKYGDAARFSFERCLEDFCICGSPATVVRGLQELVARSQPGQVLCSLNLVTQRHETCVRSMERFARDVMPALRAGEGIAAWHGPAR